MKVQLSRAFKSFFFVTKNNKKADSFSMKFSSAPNTSVPRCLNPLFQNRRPIPHSPQPPSNVRCSDYWKMYVRVKKLNPDVFTPDPSSRGKLHIRPRQNFFSEMCFPPSSEGCNSMKLWCNSKANIIFTQEVGI